MTHILLNDMNTRCIIWRFLLLPPFWIPTHPPRLSLHGYNNKIGICHFTIEIAIISRRKHTQWTLLFLHHFYCFSNVSIGLGFWRPSWICHIFHEGFIGTLESCDKLSLVSLEGVLSLLWNIYDRDTYIAVIFLISQAHLRNLWNIGNCYKIDI